MAQNFKAAGVIPYFWDAERKEVMVLLRLGIPPPQAPPQPGEQPPPPQFKEYGGPRGEETDPVVCAAKHFLAAMTGGTVQPEQSAVDQTVQRIREYEGRAAFQFYNAKNDYAIYFVQMSRELFPMIPSNVISSKVLRTQYNAPGLMHDRLVLDQDGAAKLIAWLEKLEQDLDATGGHPWTAPLPPPPQPPAGWTPPQGGAPPPAPAQ